MDLQQFKSSCYYTPTGSPQLFQHCNLNLNGVTIQKHACLKTQGGLLFFTLTSVLDFTDKLWDDQVLHQLESWEGYYNFALFTDASSGWLRLHNITQGFYFFL